MFIGEFTHTLDDKKRLSLPSKFRKELGKTVIITHGLDNCLFMFTLSQWNKIAEQLGNTSLGNADSRGFNRIMLAGAVELEVDTAGRVLIPDFLRQYIGVNGTDEKNSKLVFAGVHTRIEIWEEKKWKSYKEKILKQADSLAAKLSAIGAI
ncbi:division/cell wall cluster transcriptional repressor MraZ [Arenimonas sp.]|nr:division/cell wall cluster transcriptional repressor MraZ [Candidatus Parcubacteria bacterium]